MRFLTEEETEELQVPETRNIKRLDGTNEPFTQSKLWWEKYDYLIYTTEFHPIRLRQEAMIAAHKFNLAFDFAMTDLVTGLYCEIMQQRTPQE